MMRAMQSGLFALVVLSSGMASMQAAEIRGFYMESRTCQVYTGPCFANAEVQLTGKDAIMAWGVEEGQFQGVDLKGLNVVLVLRASDTLGFGGIQDAKTLKSVLLVDDRANAVQRDALVEFARKQAGKAGAAIARIESTKIDMSLDVSSLSGKVTAGKAVKLSTRKARPTDCICTNEVAYYPPLATLQNFAAGVAIDAEFRGGGLGNRWSMPNSRSAYMGIFAF